MKRPSHLIVCLVAMCAVTGLLAGCESDSVAPKDNLPALTEEDAAGQAAVIAMAIHQIGPAALELGAKSAPEKFDFPPGGNVQGTVETVFTCEGSPCDPGTADFGRAYTPSGTAVTLDLIPEDDQPPLMRLTFDLSGVIDQGTDTAVVTGSGTFTSDGYAALWTLNDVLFAATGFPGDGTVEFTSGDHTVVVYFDGNAEVSIDVNDESFGTINLETGAYIPPDPTP
jgi:hypothetical protein